MEPQPQLLDLFHALRKERLPLGVDEYLLALEVLWSGCGLENLEDLRFTLRLMWAKSHEEQERFDEAFDVFVKPALVRRVPAPTTMEPSSEARGGHQGMPEVKTKGSDDTSEVSQPTQAITAPKKSEPALPLTIEPEPELPKVMIPMIARMDRQEIGAPRPEGTYQFIPRLPISRREMASIWRHLRGLRREGPLVELDVEETIEQISHDGFLLQPILQPLRRNQMRLLMLIDCCESMGPFVPVTQALVESARGGGMLGRMAVYYFSYVPDTTLSPMTSLEEPRPATEILSAQADGASVLIVSDVGVAQRSYSAKRAERIRAFLLRLHTYTYRYAWLNPFPRRRWIGTTAGEVQSMIPMFPLDRDGLVDAVSILQGKPFPSGIGLRQGR